MVKRMRLKWAFKIESALDPTWVNLPLRQAEVWLFIDINETRRLSSENGKGSDKINESRF